MRRVDDSQSGLEDAGPFLSDSVTAAELEKTPILDISGRSRQIRLAELIADLSLRGSPFNTSSSIHDGMDSLRSL